jgi:hypothetical protein
VSGLVRDGLLYGADDETLQKSTRAAKAPVDRVTERNIICWYVWFE